MWSNKYQSFLYHPIDASSWPLLSHPRWWCCCWCTDSFPRQCFINQFFLLTNHRKKMLQHKLPPQFCRFTIDCVRFKQRFSWIKRALQNVTQTLWTKNSLSYVCANLWSLKEWNLMQFYNKRDEWIVRGFWSRKRSTNELSSPFSSLCAQKMCINPCASIPPVYPDLLLFFYPVQHTFFLTVPADEGAENLIQLVWLTVKKAPSSEKSRRTQSSMKSLQNRPLENQCFMTLKYTFDLH